MRWVWLAALANRWLWLVALFAGAVLFAVGAPWALALLVTAGVLGAGAAVDVRGRLAAARGERSGVEDRAVAAGRDERSASIRDPVAVSVLGRARTAVARIGATQQGLESAPSALALDVGLQADRTLQQMVTSAQQVDRLSAALSGVDVGALQHELAALDDALASDRTAGPDLTAERRRSADGLRAQLGTFGRIAEQRQLLLERLRATAVGLEGLAARSAEVAALYQGHGSADTSESDLRELGEDLDGLRAALVEAQRSVRAALKGDDLPAG